MILTQLLFLLKTSFLLRFVAIFLIHSLDQTPKRGFYFQKMKKWFGLALGASLEMEEPLIAVAQDRGWSFYTRSWPDDYKLGLFAYFRKYDEALKAKSELKQFLKNCPAWGLKPGRPQWWLTTSTEKDWFKRSLEEIVPIKVSRRIVVKPSWKPYRPNKEEVVLEINPQMAFGTGHHFTTRFCLKTIDQLGTEGKRVLDVGCGSGILGIAAAKLGAARVRGIDIDPIAIQTANANARLNKVGNVARFARKELSNWSAAPADLVLANLNGDLLLRLRRPILRLVKPSGYLVATGLLREEEKNFAKRFPSKKFSIVSRKRDSLWCGLVLRRN